MAFGLFGGMIGGLLGIGGSVGIIPLATIFITPDKQQLQCAAMLCNVAVASTAYRRYLMAGKIEWTFARRIVPAAIIAVLAGVAASTVIDASSFRVMFAAFLLVVAVREFRLLAIGSEHAPDDARELSPARGAGIGAIMGFLSGLLGIGGGVVGVPLMRAWARIPMKRAVVTSVCTMVPLAMVGATMKSITLWNTPIDANGATMSTLAVGSAATTTSTAASSATIPSNALIPALWIAACLIPTAMVGSWIGATINVHVTGKAVRWVLATYLPLAAAWMAWPVIVQWLSASAQ
ncbi:MAG TPA: hypothetical protein DCR70_06120 [Phycisphaerales bacterium]|nr:hypothetical protein [Phycisphaerales bacterium]